MCGIVILKGTKVTREDCQEVLQKQRHRGSDETSIRTFGNLQLGFNRLSINDKSEGGSQPFESENYVGVFNCEIYNSALLKEQFQLETRGGSDAEIILPLFELVGDEIINLLDGFYSGVIIEKSNQEIFLLRDYIGKKPLFCGEADSLIFISSELKGIKGISSFSLVMKGISRLRHNRSELIRSHHFEVGSSGNLKHAIIAAVNKRIPTGEKQFGVFLSGGLDSSIIAQVVCLANDNVIYYCLGDQDSEDVSFVRRLGQLLRIEDKIQYVPLPEQDEIPTLIAKTIYHTESFNPSIVSNGLATFLLARAAKEDGLKVVLSGEGADELFCGYRISKDKQKWYSSRDVLIENLHGTELRRLDLAAMAATIEVRCPFLDREVFSISQSLGIDSLIDDSQELQGKKILREIFRNDLPSEIIERRKMSCDVGSGVRKLVVQFSEGNLLGEKQNLKKLWSKYFPEQLLPYDYFSVYPVFDPYIGRRGETHAKKPLLIRIHDLLREHFQSVPFHNLFMLNGNEVLASQLGGTCSDKTLHFQEVLESNGIQSFLHLAFINGIESHRLLSIDIGEERYFIDVGSGWPCLKIFPANCEITYAAYGIQFQSLLLDSGLRVKINSGKGYKKLMFIPFQSKTEKEILMIIKNRFAPENEYPFTNAFRFSMAGPDSFLFIKGSTMRTYKTGQLYSEKQLSKVQIIDEVGRCSPTLLPELRRWMSKK